MRYLFGISLGVLGACAIASLGRRADSRRVDASRARSSSSSPARAARPAWRPTPISPISPSAGDVVALSLHVDYWDYLGWRDTLGDPAHTERQRDYAAVHGSRRIYTPQIVVNGSEDFVGSDRRSVNAAIANSSLAVPVTMRHGDGTVEIEVGARPQPHPDPGDDPAGASHLGGRGRDRRAARTPARPSTTTTSCAPCARSACGTARR